MKTSAISSERKRLTKSFFVSWLLERKLLRFREADSAGTDDMVSSGVEMPAPRPFSSVRPERGQIRVLSQTETVTYAVVLARWDDNSVLLVPFSRFDDPATEEELKTEFQGGLRMNVLQIWNARSAMETTLRKSWFVGTLPEQDVKDALLLWKWSIGDVAELPARIADRTGVPIYRTDDPRLEYRREALENFAKFDAEDDANAEKEEKGNANEFASEDFWARMKRLGHRVAEEASIAAAAASVSANSRRTFLVEGVPAKLRAEYSRSEKCLVFSVWDGKRRVKSAALDGYSLVVEPGTGTVPIRDKSARIPASSPSTRFVLLDSAGKLVDLKEEKR